jgi:lysophospholipase L1-like esterase
VTVAVSPASRISRGKFAPARLAVSLALAAIAAVAVLAPVASASPDVESQRAESGGLYVALGDSVAVCCASSPEKTYVGLLFSSYQSTLGVTQLSNRARGGETSGSIRAPGGQLDEALADIRAATDTRAVTIDIGGNDRYTCADSWDTCPYRANLAATLSDLKAALAADPGDETFIAMAYYNPASGLGGTQETRYDRGLLGSDLTISCQTAAGPDVGINDIIFQEAGRYGAEVADAYPAFKVGGQSFMADSLHPSDAGHAAIADAFLNPTAGCESPPDLTPPGTTITRAPRHRTRSHKATFGFRSNESGSTFECMLDRRRFTACRSPKTYRHLDRGRHVFKVRSTDSAGNIDSTPAQWRWKVKRRRAISRAA